MAKKNSNLHAAKNAKNDEFYTQLADIEAEISQHSDYVKHFKDKVVFCNCDDPEWSNFFLFFKLHFKQLGLKKLITTHYEHPGERLVSVQKTDDNGNLLFDHNHQPIIEEKMLWVENSSYKLEWEGEMIGDDMVNLIKTPLVGNGDFRSDECVEILKESDIVVTNPPFSLFREYVAQLIKYDKKFIIIGNKNAITYKEFFPLLKDNRVWIGYNNPSEFRTPQGMTQKLNGLTRWFTNLDIDKLHEPLILTKNYKGNEENYPKYDNYDAINVDKVKEIPKDYVPCWFKCECSHLCEYAKNKGMCGDALCEASNNGAIGVPITYMDKHNFDQFEIVDANDIRNNDNIPVKKHGLIKDKESSISVGAGDVDKSAGFSANSVANLDGDNAEISRTAEQCMRELSSGARKCNGIIGVPITFMDNYCIGQFEIIWTTDRGGDGMLDFCKFKHERYDAPVVYGDGKYKRIFIRRKEEKHDS